ncbi:flagellar filament capping protein FliD [uncultured Lentibacter sp.]|uniref:flagellar filament capping protein FliD n=1 Tax=uncultured Lentibacter sp. TaxID=1659309 RepID=UPI0026189BB8|nr:flagellar filament capping protein FliD [uncultured Lentibacter sp.]
MAVDYLSTLNSKGSGLNITQLVDSIVAAETEPAKNLINEKSSANDLSISAVALLRSRMSTLQAALGAAGTGGLYRAESSTTAVSVEVTAPNALTEAATQLNVTQLATAQVLEFGGFSSAEDVLAAGAVSVEVGAWSGTDFAANPDVAARSVSLDGTMTLTGFATALSELTGISARVVDKGDGTFSLSVVSDMGAENALRLTASTAALDAFDTTDASNEVIAAGNAQIELDGIALERPSNQITDVIAGVELTLNAVTSSAHSLTVSMDESGAKARLGALIEQINGMRGYLDEATARGLGGSERGALAGDAAIGAIKRELASLTTAPLNGFGDTPLYLSEIGVRTELDGTLSLDEEAFTATLAQAPEKFQAIYQSLNSMGQSNLEVSFSATATPPEGVHSFEFDSSGDATLEGETLSARTNSAGQQEYYALTGDFAGMTITVLEGAAASTNLYVGVSLIDKLDAYLADVLGSKGEIATKETYLGTKTREYSEELSELDAKALVVEAREMQRFAKMEQMVTQLKSTGEYITTMMEAWKNRD